MKQYLVMKMAEKVGSVISMVPVPGIFDRDGAERLIQRLKETEPHSVFLIQEVGAA